MRLDEVTDKVTHNTMEYALCETLLKSTTEAASCGYKSFDPIHPLLVISQISPSVTLRKRLDPLLTAIAGGDAPSEVLRLKVVGYVNLEVQHESHAASKRMFEIMRELSTRRSKTSSALMTRGDLAIAIFLSGSPLLKRLLEEVGVTSAEVLENLGASGIVYSYLASVPSAVG